MADPYPIASDLSYRVLQRQRAEAQATGLQAHESPQGAYPRAVTGIPGDILREFVRLTDLSDRDETPTWHRHGRQR